MPARTKRGIYKYLSFAVRAFFTILLLGVLASAVDLRAVRLGLDGNLVRALILSFLLLIAALVFSAVRWVLVSRMVGVRLGAMNAFAVVMIGHFFNQLLPTSFGGDAVRGWWLCRQGTSVKDSFASVFLDRLFGLMALMCLVVMGLPLLAYRLGTLIPLYICLALVFFLLIGIGLISRFALMSLSGAGRFFPHFLRKRGQWARSILDYILIYKSRLFESPLDTMSAIALSLAIHISALYTIAVISDSLGAPLSMLDALLIVPTVLFLTALPISIGGWGVREAGLAGGFSLIGLDPGVAVTASILLGLINFASGVVGGAIFVAMGSPRPQSIEGN